VHEEPAGTFGGPSFRAGYVTIMGEPNVGKSTLLNRILKQKISIVSSKPQTTRHRILGILTEETHQIIFLDTPGIIKPRYLLQEAMMQFAGRAIADADVLLFMIDALDPKTGSDLAHAEAFRRLQELRKPVILVINKIDLVEKSMLLPVIEFYSHAFPFREIFPISALTGEGTQDLQKTLIPLLPVHPPLYPPDIVSEQSERFFVSEIIREKVFRACHEEVPYATTVEVLEFKERAHGKWFIAADIYVERDSQKGILIGKKGAMLKELGGQARKDIEGFLGHPVFLELHVKVREKWREKPEWLQRLGYGGGETP
jgi:GTP-binding protein Era